MKRKYPLKARAALLREARKRSQRSPAPRSKRRPSPITPALLENAMKPCDWHRCERPRRGLGRYCKAHAWNYAKTGHPLALSIRRRVWAPFVRQAEAFVTKQLLAGHPSIEAGIRWVAHELASAEHPTTHDPAHLSYVAALLRANRYGVDPAAFLARAIAGELADDRDTGEPGPRLASDQHAVHQKARLFLYPMPFGLEASSWARRKRVPQDPIWDSRLRWGVRAYTHDRVTNALGLLARKAAAEIRRREANQSLTTTDEE